MPPFIIELAQRGTALALKVVDRRDPATPPKGSLDERIDAYNESEEITGWFTMPSASACPIPPCYVSRHIVEY